MDKILIVVEPRREADHIDCGKFLVDVFVLQRSGFYLPVGSDVIQGFVEDVQHAAEIFLLDPHVSAGYKRCLVVQLGKHHLALTAENRSPPSKDVRELVVCDVVVCFTHFSFSAFLFLRHVMKMSKQMTKLTALHNVI